MFIAFLPFKPAWFEWFSGNLGAETDRWSTPPPRPEITLKMDHDLSSQESEEAAPWVKHQWYMEIVYLYMEHSSLTNTLLSSPDLPSIPVIQYMKTDNLYQTIHVVLSPMYDVCTRFSVGGCLREGWVKCMPLEVVKQPYFKGMASRSRKKQPWNCLQDLRSAKSLRNLIWLDFLYDGVRIARSWPCSAHFLQGKNINVNVWDSHTKTHTVISYL